MSEARRAAALFEKSVIPEPNSGCFLWIGTVGGMGYGRIRRGGRSVMAHRVASHEIGDEIGRARVLAWDRPKGKRTPVPKTMKRLRPKRGGGA